MDKSDLNQLTTKELIQFVQNTFYAVNWSQRIKKLTKIYKGKPCTLYKKFRASFLGKREKINLALDILILLINKEPIPKDLQEELDSYKNKDQFYPAPADAELRKQDDLIYDIKINLDILEFDNVNYIINICKNFLLNNELKIVIDCLEDFNADSVYKLYLFLSKCND